MVVLYWPGKSARLFRRNEMDVSISFEVEHALSFYAILKSEKHEREMRSTAVDLD